MKEHSIIFSNNFIGGWYMDDLTLCDRIIEFHKTTQHKGPGRMGDGVVKDIKDSIDTYLDHDQKLYDEYKSHVNTALKLYADTFNPFVEFYDYFGIAEPILVQHYQPKGGYKSWHCERGNFQTSKRHLVFMTYLNDLDDCGGTEFFYQKTIVKPKKGLTLVWPPDWTFTHRSEISPTQEKYLTTGWVSFKE